METELGIARALARDAGHILLRYFARELRVDHKGSIDLVTEADRASEAHITAGLRRAFADHAIVAEESGEHHAGDALRWVVDPLDGTVNFAHGNPHFCVLIALQARRDDGFHTLLGVTWDPLRAEEFVAVAGEGATLNGQAIRPSRQARAIDCLGATGFGYDRLLTPPDNHAEFCRMNLATQGVRRFGSAGLDLAYVACGRLDFYWEYGLKLWDMAAGALLVAEAGGRVSDLAGQRLTPEGRDLLASNGAVHGAALEIIASAAGHPTNSRAGLAAHLPPELAARLAATPVPPV